MSGGELSLFHQLPHRPMETQKPQGVGHGAAGFSHPLGRLLLGHVIGLNERLEARRFLHGVQVLPLEVFHQSQFGRFLVVSVHHHGGYFAETRQTGSPPAPFSGDNLIVAGGELPHGQGLDNAMLPNGIRQLRQGRFVKEFSGLGGVTFYLRNR